MVIYTAWGEIDSQYNTDSSNPNPIGYAGEFQDSESGMIYLRGRYYDPEIRRFITEDPAKDGWNWYAYCGNNPVMRVDPSGYSWISDQIVDAWNNAKWAFQNMDMYPQVNKEFKKYVQREFWKTGAQKYLRESRGYETSAWLLEHSLQDSPSDVYRDNNSRIAYLINNDSAYLRALDRAIASSDNGKVIGYLDNIVFESGDLYYSIHKSTIYVDGYQKENGQWIIHATMTDTYDFTEIQSFMGSFGLGTLANDAAVISQTTGAINPYKITVDFYTTR